MSGVVGEVSVGHVFVSPFLRLFNRTTTAVLSFVDLWTGDPYEEDMTAEDFDEMLTRLTSPKTKQQQQPPKPAFPLLTHVRMAQRSTDRQRVCVSVCESVSESA